MSEQQLLRSVDLARARLTALVSLLDSAATTPEAPELKDALVDVRETLDILQSRYDVARDVLDLTNDLVFAKDLDGRYAMINPHGASMFQRTVDDVLGSDDRSLFDAPDADRIMTVDRAVMSSGESHESEETCSVGGVRTILLTRTNAWLDKEHQVRGVLGIAKDVTASRVREDRWDRERERMSSLATAIVTSEERLRRSLADELHDGIGQDIALAKMKLAMVRSTLSSELRGRLVRIENLIERADRSLRSITARVSPLPLHDLGLVAALQGMGEELGRKLGIAVRVVDEGAPVVDDESVRVILFRAVRELLANVAAHSDAHEAVVRLSPSAGGIRIQVEDSGGGFVAENSEDRGFGIFGIRVQLKSIGGSLDVATAPGHGTKVTMTVPLHPRGRDWLTGASHDDPRPGRDG